MQETLKTKNGYHEQVIENNQVTIMGEIASGFTFSHEVFGEGFYMVDVLVKRLSNSDDRIPLMISERLIDVTQDYEGEYIMVSGQFRSYNRHEEQKNRLVLSVFVREVEFVEEEMDGAKTNSILLDISAKRRCIERHRLEEKLQIFCWRSTDLMENQIISLVFAGGAMQDMRPDSKWERMSRCLEGSRAGNT